MFFTPYVEAFRGLPFLDEVRPSKTIPFPPRCGRSPCARVVWYIVIVNGYRDGAVELLYEGSLPPRRHIARIFGDQLGLDVGDVRPSCIFDQALIREYQRAWADLPRPWLMVNRKANNSPNKDWMGEHWDRLITSLLNRYTVIEIGRSSGPEGPVTASPLCRPDREAPARSFPGRGRRGRHPRRPGFRAGARRRRGRQTVGRHLRWL